MSIIEIVKEDLGLRTSGVTGEGVPDVEAAWHINLYDLELGDIIGEGAYGKVYSGFYFGTEVAIKRIDVEKMGKDNMAKYLRREIACSKFVLPTVVCFFFLVFLFLFFFFFCVIFFLFFFLYRYSHPNIVGFIGIAEEVDAKYIYLVTEKLQCSLRAILKAEDDEDTPLDWTLRISFANDSAKAICFLHAKRIIHRGILIFFISIFDLY